MHISEFRIQNFRSIKDISIIMSGYAVLLGPNNSGKSNILRALNLFFSASTKGISEEDFFQKDISKPIEIEVVFSSLKPEQENLFKDYLINGNLRVKKIIKWDEKEQKFEQTLYIKQSAPQAEYLNENKFQENKELIKEKVKEGKLPKKFLSESGNPTKESFESGMTALRAQREKYPEIEWSEEWEEKPFGWKNVNQGYLMDCVFIPAVREAEEEAEYSSTSLLGKIIDKKTQSIPEDEKKKIEDLLKQIKKCLQGDSDFKKPEFVDQLEKTLAQEIGKCMPGVKIEWQIDVPDLEGILKESYLKIDDGINTEVNAKGHGLQRILIFALFKLYSSLAIQEKKTANPTLFAIEEPEIFLHPQLQRAFFKLLKQLSADDQAIFCTHSPYFIDLLDFKKIVIVNKNEAEKSTIVWQIKGDLFENDKEKLKLITQTTAETNELFFARKVILVEGIGDELALRITAEKMGIDLNEKGVTIIACGGKPSIPFFQKLSEGFKITHVVMYDSDTNQASQSKNLNEEIKSLAKGNVFEINGNLEKILGINKKSSYDIKECLDSKKPEEIPEVLKNVIIRACE